ncbi:putative F-box protein At3g17490 [Bidens hawaiensis]|uniref:putative F-box protein At3g17490 n=1 Tax=Bidens hawaiensis TaxID=980011 RepID=UPI00404A3D29
MTCLLVAILEFHILVRLMAKDIGRCRTVCKKWYSFLSTPKFARLHWGATSSSAKKVVLATPENSDDIATIIYQLTSFYHVKVIDIPFNEHPFEFITLGSLDGMLCVCLKNNSRMSIWNPLTGCKRDLPTYNDNSFFKVYSDAFAFYLDSSNEYKCLHVKHMVRESVCIYSTISNTWREITVDKEVVFRNKNDKWSLGTLCLDGIYFTVGEFWSAFVELILRFDVNLETFTNVGLPSFPYEAGWHYASC